MSTVLEKYFPGIKEEIDNAHKGNSCVSCRSLICSTNSREENTPGGVYSDAGRREYCQSGMCEFCFDLLDEDGDERYDPNYILLQRKKEAQSLLTAAYESAEAFVKSTIADDNDLDHTDIPFLPDASDDDVQEWLEETAEDAVSRFLMVSDVLPFTRQDIKRSCQSLREKILEVPSGVVRAAAFDRVDHDIISEEEFDRLVRLAALNLKSLRREPEALYLGQCVVNATLVFEASVITRRGNVKVIAEELLRRMTESPSPDLTYVFSGYR